MATAVSVAISIVDNALVFLAVVLTILFVLFCVIAICNYYYRKVYKDWCCKSYESEITKLFEREEHHYPHKKRARQIVSEIMGNNPLLHLHDHDGDRKFKVLTHFLFTKLNATEVRYSGGGGGGDDDDIEANCGKENVLEATPTCVSCSKKFDDIEESNGWIVMAGCLHMYHKECASQRNRCCWRPEGMKDLKEVFITVKPLLVPSA